MQLGNFFLGTQARVQNSHGKQAISVRATEVLLYLAQPEQCLKATTSLEYK